MLVRMALTRRHRGSPTSNCRGQISRGRRLGRLFGRYESLQASSAPPSRHDSPRVKQLRRVRRKQCVLVDRRDM